MHVYCFFLNPYQRGFRWLFLKHEGCSAGGPPIPLSPYLFVLGMDILSCLINKAVEGNFLLGYKIGGVGEEQELG